jgi:hypothetical protein
VGHSGREVEKSQSSGDTIGSDSIGLNQKPKSDQGIKTFDINGFYNSR